MTLNNRQFRREVLERQPVALARCPLQRYLFFSRLRGALQAAIADLRCRVMPTCALLPAAFQPGLGSLDHITEVQYPDILVKRNIGASCSFLA